MVFPAQSGGFRGSQNVVPMPMSNDTLQIYAVEFSISEEHDLRPFGNHFPDTLNQLDMLLFAEMPFFLFLNQPRNGQRPLFVDDCNDERHAAAAHNGPIN